jgi:hypothetical protein
MSSSVDNDCAFVEDEGGILQQAVQENNAMLVQEQGGLEEEHTLLQQEQDAVGPCVSEQVYIDSGNCKKILYLLCIGTTTPLSDNAPLFSLDEEPWSTLPKSTFHPKNNDFVSEIVRRAKELKLDPLPRPTNWNRVRTIEWLERYPITCGDDIRFLTGEVLRVRDTLLRKQQEELQEREQHLGFLDGGNSATTRGGHWRGCVPYLRIILCLTQDAVKRLFLARADARSQAELDARNSDSRYASSLSFHIRR